MSERGFTPPARDARAGSERYANLLPDRDTGHFAALWHTYSLGHLVSVDLNRIARQHDLSIEDLLVLGTFRTSAATSLRPTDLAYRLCISNAAVSGRTARLVKAGLLERRADEVDRRSHRLVLTDDGARTADAAIARAGESGLFARAFAGLSEEDQAQLGRILGELHDRLARDFLPNSR